MIERRRLLLMRHGEVEYFTPDGKPLPPADVHLTANGVAQARAVGRLLADAATKIDRAWSSGLPRTRATLAQVLEAMGSDVEVRQERQLEEIRPGRLADIPRAELRQAFVAPFEGAVPLATRFLGGETIGALLDRVLPALRALLADDDWDTALLVAHGGVNRALLSWFLTGERLFLGGLAQDPGCLNIIDIGPEPAQTVVRVVNLCPLEWLQNRTRASTMENLLQQYLRRGEGAAFGREDS
jgi:broad specificity phosphatase PhoE